jgi:hypothetical protein
MAITRRSGEVKAMFEREDAHYVRDRETGLYDVRVGKKTVKVGMKLGPAAEMVHQLKKPQAALAPVINRKPDRAA